MPLPDVWRGLNGLDPETLKLQSTVCGQAGPQGKTYELWHVRNAHNTKAKRYVLNLLVCNCSRTVHCLGSHIVTR